MANRSLKIFRARYGLTQADMAEKMGWSRQYYAKTENGRSLGSVSFWIKMQNAFEIPDREMWPLVKGTKD